MEKLKLLSKNITKKMPSIQGTVTLNVFAQRCNLDVDTISEILKGNTKNPGVYTIAKIADVFGCSVDELVSESESDNADIKLKISLARKCITITVDLLRKKNRLIELDDFLLLLEGIYLNSIAKNLKDIDIKFAEVSINDFFKK